MNSKSNATTNALLKVEQS